MNLRYKLRHNINFGETLLCLKELSAKWNKVFWSNSSEEVKISHQDLQKLSLIYNQVFKEEFDAFFQTSTKEQGIAEIAHANQYRRDGMTPYMYHVHDVVRRVGDDKDAQAVAWLHDVIEDTDLTANTLKGLGVEPHIIDAVEILTKKDGEKYSDYLEKVKQNELATKVKIADMISNLSDNPTKNQIKKYALGLTILTDAF